MHQFSVRGQGLTNVMDRRYAFSVMLKFNTRKSLILKGCYMLRYFQSVCGGWKGCASRQEQYVPHIVSARPYI